MDETERQLIDRAMGRGGPMARNFYTCEPGSTDCIAWQGLVSRDLA